MSCCQEPRERKENLIEMYLEKLEKLYEYETFLENEMKAESFEDYRHWIVELIELYKQYDEIIANLESVGLKFEELVKWANE